MLETLIELESTFNLEIINSKFLNVQVTKRFIQVSRAQISILNSTLYKAVSFNNFLIFSFLDILTIENLIVLDCPSGVLNAKNSSMKLISSFFINTQNFLCSDSRILLEMLPQYVFLEKCFFSNYATELSGAVIFFLFLFAIKL